MGLQMYRIETEGEVTTAHSTVLCAVVAVPCSLSDLETTWGIRGLEPAPVF